jgi:hypothetical protein
METPQQPPISMPIKQPQSAIEGQSGPIADMLLMPLIKANMPVRRRRVPQIVVFEAQSDFLQALAYISGSQERCSPAYNV